MMQLTKEIFWREYAWLGADEQKYETVQGCPPIEKTFPDQPASVLNLDRPFFSAHSQFRPSG
jgi:hypothetical protein